MLAPAQLAVLNGWVGSAQQMSPDGQKTSGSVVPIIPTCRTSPPTAAVVTSLACPIRRAASNRARACCASARSMPTASCRRRNRCCLHARRPTPCWQPRRTATCSPAVATATSCCAGILMRRAENFPRISSSPPPSRPAAGRAISSFIRTSAFSIWSTNTTARCAPMRTMRPAARCAKFRCRKSSRAMQAAERVIPGVFAELSILSGRNYAVLDAYGMQGAETAVVLLNSAAETAKDVADERRAAGARTEGKQAGFKRRRQRRHRKFRASTDGCRQAAYAQSLPAGSLRCIDAPVEKIWRARPDSNGRPSASEADTLSS